MNRLTSRLAVVTVACATAVLGLAAPGRAAPAPSTQLITTAASSGTGAIAGHVTTPDGSPAADTNVYLFDSGYGRAGAVTTDASGAFTFTGLAAGGYQMRLQVAMGPSQWYHQQRSVEAADVVMVADGQVTQVDETMLATGKIAGHLTDVQGDPLAGATVYIESTDYAQLARRRTDAAGSFSADLLPGQYRVSFFVNSVTQYIPQSALLSGAGVFAVVAGATTSVDDRLMATGTVGGHLTDAAGQPLVGSFVTLYSTVDGRSTGWDVAAADGTYRISAFPGTYRLSFTTADQTVTQWARGKLTEQAADAFTVTAGADTTLDDAMLPTGSIEVTATDAVTHAAIADFCASADGQSGCSNGTGRAVVSGVRQGTETATVQTPDGLHFSVDQAVEVTGGQSARLAVSLRAAAAIVTTVVDSATGQPVSGVCVWVMPVGTFPADREGACSDEQGQLRQGQLASGAYQIFAHVGWGTSYGDQWVGAHGGTGNQMLARITTVKVGTATTVPPIKLDPGGSVTGTVTDGTTGAPVRAMVALNGQVAGEGGNGRYTSTDTIGRYTLSNLGPYEWPLLFRANGFAEQWSGGTPNRYLAKGVKVVAGGTVGYDATLTAGTALRGTVRTGDGRPYGAGGYVTVHNALTGDAMGESWVNPDGTYVIRVLGPQLVKIEYALGGGTQQVGWYGGKDRAHAAVILVPDCGVRTVNIALG